MWRREFWCESEGLGIVWKDFPFTLVVFRLNDCATDDCEAIEPSRINLALKTTTDGCAIHDTRIGVSMLIRLHRDWNMWNNYALINGHYVWLGRQRTLAEALAISRKWRRYHIATVKE